MKKIHQFLLFILLGILTILFNSWIIYEGYILLSNNFTIGSFMLPDISYGSMLCAVSFISLLRSGSSHKNTQRTMDDPKLYSDLLSFALTKFAALGFFWIITLFM